MDKLLETKRLILRQVEDGDATVLFKMWSDPEVTEFLNIDTFRELKQAEEMIRMLNQLAKEEKAIRYTIIDKASNRIIGTCGFNHFNKYHGNVSIGYDLAKDVWGQGYGQESITALLDHAFHDLDMHRVEAEVEPGNDNSVRLLEKLSFTYEGTLRDRQYAKGRYTDLMMFSKLKTD